MAATSKQEFLSKPTWNPLEVAADPRVAMTAGGVLAAYLKRKAAYRQFRGTFGIALKDGGEVRYFAPSADDPNTPTGDELPGAYLNRLLFNLSDVLLGSLLIGRVQDPNVDYFGLGIAAGGFGNLVMTLLNLD